MTARKLWIGMLAIGLASLVTLPAAAQDTDGIIGDPSGASIVGANVRVTNMETGQVFTAVTDSSGYYRVVHVHPGKYTVRVEQSGLRVSEATGVVVNVDTTSRVDLKLQVGAVSEKVEVSGGSPLVQTEESRLADIKDLDMSLFKNTELTERLNVQFRAEIFNLFNRTNLYNPSGAMGASFFGQSIAAFASRQIQFGLKFLF